MNNKPNLIKKIERSIGQIRELSKIGASVEVKSAEGQFKVVVSLRELQCILLHGWDGHASYDRPGTLDLILANLEQEKSYVVYMTESELEMLPELVQEARELIYSFLQGEYDIKKPLLKWIGSEDLVMRSSALTYRYASETKTFVTANDFKDARRNY